ncbi:terminase small subunit [Lysobacter sp. M15]|uniref:terminase small subunit n=1 Tax=Lysobacter sp. M15 TaxID=2916837 RepID=UPI001F569E59|nr:terminase small subunit [Lysobacter sp. M15]
MTKLTDKQEAFAVNKAAGVPNREAAIAAGYAEGSADVAAHRLMQKPAIKAAIKAAVGGKRAAPGVTTPKMPRTKYADPVTFLEDVMNHGELPLAMRADAAKQLLPYKHARMGEVGKKQAKADNAKDIARGKHKFATKAAPPALSLVRNE